MLSPKPIFPWRRRSRPNYRISKISHCMEAVSSLHKNEKLNIIEIGCMFSREQGLSTQLLAEYVSKHPAGGKVFSFECEKEHIENCKEIIQSHNPKLADVIEYHHGFSQELLPEVLASNGPIHFALLDGSGHPEYALLEFEIIAPHLAPNGVFLVDDAHELAPTKHYPFARPFGKATLILPLLITQAYRHLRGTLKGPTAVTDFVKFHENTTLCFKSEQDFALLGQHYKMLAIGPKPFIQETLRIETVTQ